MNLILAYNVVWTANATKPNTFSSLARFAYVSNAGADKDG